MQVSPPLVPGQTTWLVPVSASLPAFLPALPLTTYLSWITSLPHPLDLVACVWIHTTAMNAPPPGGSVVTSPLCWLYGLSQLLESQHILHLQPVIRCLFHLLIWHRKTWAPWLVCSKNTVNTTTQCVLPGNTQPKDLLPSPLLAACDVILFMSGVQCVRRGKHAHLPKCQWGQPLPGWVKVTAAVKRMSNNAKCKHSSVLKDSRGVHVSSW